MEKEVKIIPPEGYEIDRNNSSLEKIVFKKIDTKPRSWEEYCEQQTINNKKGYQICDTDCNISELCWYGCSTINNWRNVLPSEELAEAFLAMMQLMSLRQAWIGEWKPDWNDSTNNFIIQCECNKLLVDSWKCMSRPLSFSTKEMAEEFLTCFKDLLEIAKPLI